MTTPNDPRETATRPSDTGWPSAPGPPPELAYDAPLVSEPAYEPDPASERGEAVASDAASVDVAPVLGRNEQELGAAEPAQTRGRGLGLPVVALLLTTILMAVATGFVWYQVHQHDATEAARRAGLETSRDAARVLFSYDYRTLDKDFSAGKAITTGKFRQEYSETTSKVVTPVAQQKKAVVKAEVVTAGIVRASTDTVVTIVYVNQVTTSSLSSGPKVDLSRVRMTLERVGGHWLVSKVDAL